MTISGHAKVPKPEFILPGFLAEYEVLFFFLENKSCQVHFPWCWSLCGSKMLHLHNQWVMILAGCGQISSSKFLSNHPTIASP